MKSDVPVYLCVDKNYEAGDPVHFSRSRRPDLLSLFCRLPAGVELKRQVYRADGKLGVPNFCRACVAAAVPFVVIMANPPRSPRQPKPGSAKAPTLSLLERAGQDE